MNTNNYLKVVILGDPNDDKKWFIDELKNNSSLKSANLNQYYYNNVLYEIIEIQNNFFDVKNEKNNKIIKSADCAIYIFNDESMISLIKLNYNLSLLKDINNNIHIYICEIKNDLLDNNINKKYFNYFTPHNKKYLLDLMEMIKFKSYEPSDLLDIFNNKIFPSNSNKNEISKGNGNNNLFLEFNNCKLNLKNCENNLDNIKLTLNYKDETKKTITFRKPNMMDLLQNQNFITLNVNDYKVILSDYIENISISDKNNNIIYKTKPNTKKSFTISIVGYPGSGKSSYVKKLITQKFHHNYIPTKSIEEHNLNFTYNKEDSIQFKVLDIPYPSNSEIEFKHLFNRYYNSSECAIFMLDINSKTDFLNILRGIQDLIEIFPNIHICLCITKCDTEKFNIHDLLIKRLQKSVSFSHNFSIFMISSKYNNDILKPFEYFTKKCLNLENITSFNQKF